MKDELVRLLGELKKENALYKDLWEQSNKNNDIEKNVYVLVKVLHFLSGLGGLKKF